MRAKKIKPYQESVLGRNPKSQLSLQLMVLPAVVTAILFSYLPMYGVIIAFKNYNVFKGIAASPWAANNGFEHFIKAFGIYRSKDLKDFVICKAFIPKPRNASFQQAQGVS